MNNTGILNNVKYEHHIYLNIYLSIICLPSVDLPVFFLFQENH